MIVKIAYENQFRDEKFRNLSTIIIMKLHYFSSLSLSLFMPQQEEIHLFSILFDFPYSSLQIIQCFFEGKEGVQSLRFFEKMMLNLSITSNLPKKINCFLSDNYQFQAKTISYVFTMERSSNNLMKFSHSPHKYHTDLRYHKRKLANSIKITQLSPLYLYHWYFISNICMQANPSKIERSQIPTQNKGISLPSRRQNLCYMLLLSLFSEFIVFIIVTQSYQDFQMIESSSLTPKCFLKSKEMREKYQCGICYEICIKPVKCKGTCARIFCMKCVSDTRQVLDRCPNRCSSPFLVAPIPDIQVDFFCPYNPTLCKLSITSLKSFNQHHQTCQFVSPQEAHLKKLQRQYKCLKAHQLEFFIGSYEEMIGSTCVQCQEQKLCRSYCRICQQFYCVTCRIPPCSKQGCPIGHSFNFQRIANLNYICDICGISTAVSNDGVYDDNHCNFGICEACFSQLPQKFDQSKPKSIIANINTQCSCGNTLNYVNVVHKASVCQLCKKTKECPKQCNNCQKVYCIDCKLMDVFSDSTCSQEHPISSFSLVGYEQFMQKENNFGCMKCSKKCNEYYYDRSCFTRLCEGCFTYCMKVTTDKERPVLLKCDKNHVLMYICGAEDYYDNCAKCEKQKIVKLACNYCEEDKRTYCFQCKPIPLNTCYYQHKLKFGQFQSERQCHFCIKNYKQFYYCKKCFFFVCKRCKEDNLKDLMEPQEMCGGVPHHHESIEEQL